jgi:hypothetical protein
MTTKLRLQWLFLVGLILWGLILWAEQKVSAAVEPKAIRQAENANDFVESIGVNTHVNFNDTVYGNYDGSLKPNLLYLGVRHVRDGLAVGGDNALALKRFRDLHNVGIKVTACVPYKVESMPALIDMIKTQRDVLAAVEGPNETDVFTEFSYGGQKFPEGTIAFMKDFYTAIKKDPQLLSLPVLQTTLAFPSRKSGNTTYADLLGNLSAYADYGNSHNYFEFGQPPSDRIANDHLPFGLKITPGKPIMSSEGGYQMGDGDGYKGGWGDGLTAPFSEDVHGRYLLRYVLEQYRLGYTRSFIYELFDIDLPQWGLFRADGTPRPAADGIRSMIKLLSEGGWDNSTKRWVVSSFAPGKLDYTLSGQPESVHSLLFQKSDGTFYLVAWNEVKNWDPVTGSAVYTSPVPVTLTMNQPIKQLRTFLPLTNGTTATATFASSTATILVPDHPIIIEITRQ